MTGRPARDSSDSRWPGCPSTLSVKFFAGPRLRGARAPEPTVAPTTMSATATVTTAAATIATRGLRAAAQLGVPVTAPHLRARPAALCLGGELVSLTAHRLDQF